MKMKCPHCGADLSSVFSKLGKKGASERAKKTTPEQRSAAARKASAARWGKLSTVRSAQKTKT